MVLGNDRLRCLREHVGRQSETRERLEISLENVIVVKYMDNNNLVKSFKNVIVVKSMENNNPVESLENVICAQSLKNVNPGIITEKCYCCRINGK